MGKENGEKPTDFRGRLFSDRTKAAKHVIHANSGRTMV
jgi:hypothetical protein